MYWWTLKINPDMKRKHIKKLEKALEGYDRVIKNISAVYEDCDDSGEVFFNSGIKVSAILKPLIADARYDRNFLESKKRALENLVEESLSIQIKNGIE